MKKLLLLLVGLLISCPLLHAGDIRTTPFPAESATQDFGGSLPVTREALYPLMRMPIPRRNLFIRVVSKVRGRLFPQVAIYDVACPTGTSVMPNGQTVNPTNGHFKAFLCVDSFGNVSSPQIGSSPVTVTVGSSYFTNGGYVRLGNASLTNGQPTITCPSNDCAGATAGQIVYCTNAGTGTGYGVGSRFCLV